MAIMKHFGNYQWVPGMKMTTRDKLEEHSAFWNDGKFNNFVLPFIEKDVNGMTFIDVGCNSGVFLKMAEDMGFNEVIGIESNGQAFRNAMMYRESNKGKYKLLRKHFHRMLDLVPLCDYIVFANTHYYIIINYWLDCVDKLINKARYCIIITAEKKRRECMASGYIKDIRSYFRNWQETGYINGISLMEGDPLPRPLHGLCFKSPNLKRVPFSDMRCENYTHAKFYEQIDEGIAPLKTDYIDLLKKRSRRKWPDSRLERYVIEKAQLYSKIKKRGVLAPIIIDENNLIIDGNHRYKILKHLGHESAIVRQV